jgi:hypothetical protein
MLPRLLAGPIVRRCTNRDLTFWIAASQRVGKLQVDVESVRGGRIHTSTMSIEIHVALQLFVYILRVSGTFPSGVLLLYRVRGLTEEEQADCRYEGVGAASLALPEEGSGQFRALHGSCRKSGGPDFDASLAGDTLMQARINDPRRRPHAMLLTGDQVYADDVPQLLMTQIQGLGLDLIGFEEPLPGIKKPYIDAINRQPVMKTAGFTSGAASNHLLTFGEYCAAYLLAWNPKLWPATWPTGKQEEMQVILDRTRAGSKALRRLLANLPTYMIFDDHEVTDDWFLNDQIKNAMLGTPFGRRVVANGITAFWLFQGIGNDPDVFVGTKDFRIDGYLADHLARLKETDDPLNDASTDFDKYLVQHDRTWSFVTPTRPGIVFLNTRTRRAMSPSRSKRHSKVSLEQLGGKPAIVTQDVPYPEESPRLMNAAERIRVRDLVRQALANDSRLVVVAPAPVYGLDAVESIINALVTNGALSAAAADLESYHADPNSFLDLAEILLNPGGASPPRAQQPSVVVILSGDVHYGFSVATALIDLAGVTGAVPVAQFVSSAMKNSPVARDALLLTLAEKAQEFSRDNLRYWWRGDVHGVESHGSISVQDSDILGSHPHSLFTGALQPYSELCDKKAGSAKLKLAEAYRFVKLGKSIVEAKNNMGYVEFSRWQVANRLIKWSSGGYEESLETHWDAKSSWPVSMTLDREMLIKNETLIKTPETLTKNPAPALPELRDLKPLPN